nr:hypothetical protein [Tanacetum cinerariifolium]
MSNISRELLQMKELVLYQGFTMYLYTNLKVRKSLETKHKEEDVNKRVHTPSDYGLTDDEKIREEEKIDDKEIMDGEEDNEVTKELHDDVNQEEKDAHVTLTYVLDTQKPRGLTQSSTVSSDFTSKLLNLDNPSPTDNEIASLMDTSAYHATTIPEITSSFTIPTPPLPLFFNPLSQLATPTLTLTASEITTSLPALPEFAFVFKFNERVNNLEKDLSEIKQVYQYAQALSSILAIVDRYMDNKLREAINKAIQAHNFNCREEAHTEKRSRDEEDKDQDPFAGLDRRTKRRKSSKEAEPSRDSRSKEKMSLSTLKDTTQSQHKSSGKSAHAEDLTSNSKSLTQEILVEPKFILLKGTYKSITDLEYHFEECSKATTERLDWHNPENKPYLFDLRKPFLLIQDHRGRHLEEIEVRRDDQKLYKFREGDFKRLRLQDVEDMLFLLVQQKLTNLTIDKRRKRLIRTDELYKFSDGILNDVQSTLYDIAAVITMEYLPMRKWSNLDKKRDRVMVQDIDKQLYQRRLMQNLEKFVGGKEYENDLRLLERTI